MGGACRLGRVAAASAFTDDMRLAWSRIYNQLASIMIDAMESAQTPAAAS